MNDQLAQWLSEFDGEIALNTEGDVLSQTTDNMFSIGASQQCFEKWGASSVREFILACRDMVDRKRMESPILFYSWLDEQAMQLRFCAANVAENELPFRCDVSHCELDRFLESLFRYESGLSCKEAKLLVWRAWLA